MREMKDSGVEWVGDIPVGWETLSYKHVAHVVACLRNPHDYPEYPQVSPDCIEKGAGKLLDYGTVEEAGVISDNHLFHKGQIIYSKVRPALNKLIVAPFDGMCSADMYPIETSQNTRWLYYYMLSNAFLDQIIVSADRVKMPKVNKDELGRFIIIKPPLPEQQRIADYLDERCAAIDEVRQTIANEIEALRRLRKATIHRAVTKGLDEGVPTRDSGIEWIGEIPSNWRITQVKRLYSVTLGKMVEKALDSIGKLTDRYLCAANIGWGGIKTSVHREMPFTSAEKAAYAVYRGDVVVMEGGATAGTTCMYRGEFGDVTYMQNSVLACRRLDGESNDFLAYWMELVYFSGYRDATCNSATFAHYTKDKVETTPIIIIPQDEEQEIIDYLNERCAAIDSVIATRTKQLARLEDYRKALIFVYVTGKKEVPTHV